jgi:hypothetical protein
MHPKFLHASLKLVALMFISFSLFISCKKTGIPPADQPYDLDVFLFSPSKLDKASGFIKFRQDKDTARIVTLETWVTGLSPHTSFQLQRAVNPITDSDCSSVAWLTLGKGLAPLSLHTDGAGFGHAEFFRDLTAATRGTTFHIHFQIIDSITKVSVLTSDCYMFTVR